MNARKVLAVAVVVPLVAGMTAASAAAPKKAKPKPKPKPKKPVCNLVLDPANDSTGTGTGAEGPNDPYTDILSADVATNATQLSAIFRVAQMDSNASTTSIARAYDMAFTARGQRISFRTIISSTGSNTWADGKGQGIVDTGAKEVRVWVPLSSFEVPLKPNEKLTDLAVTVQRWVASAGAYSATLGVTDRAFGTTPYVIGWPSCEAVGK